MSGSGMTGSRSIGKSEEYAAALGEDSPLFMQLPVTYMVGHENLVVGDASGQMGGDDGLNVAALV